MIKRACELLYPSMIDTRHHRFYQMFQRWYNPRTNKFEYGLNMKCVWYDMMGEEIEWGFTICDFKLEGQTNWHWKILAKGLCLKNDAAFALLITISPHMVAMLNEIYNLLKLDAILNGKPIGLNNHTNWQRGNNIGEGSSRKDNRL
jgi:hypothetical protein